MAAATRHLLDVDGLGWADLRWRLAVAAHMRAIRDAAPGGIGALRGERVATLFYEASTRTRISFELAASALGAAVIPFSVGASSVGKGESLVDTVRTLGALGSTAIVVRHERAGAPWLAAVHFPGSVLNAGDGWHAHPTQALLDLAVLVRAIPAADGSLAGRRIAIVGDLLHSRVVRSNLHTLIAAGAEVRLAGPAPLVEGFAHYADALGRAGARSSDEPRGRALLCGGIEEALEGADAAMALRIQRERLDGLALGSAEEYRRAWGLTEERIAARAAPDCVVLHPGPMNEGVEIDPEVADGPRSLVLDQVAEGVPTRMASLWLALRGLDAALPELPR